MKINTPHWVKVIVCFVLKHDWRSDSNIKRHCNVCKTKEKRAGWDWNKWVPDKDGF